MYGKNNNITNIVPGAEDFVAIVSEIEKNLPPTRGMVSFCQNLNVRRNPSAEAEVLTTIGRGMVVDIVEMNDESFYKVKTPTGIEGYCMRQFIEIE